MKNLILLILIFPLIATAEEDVAESLALNEKGVAAVQEKDFDDAEDYFLEALEEDAYNLTAVFNLAGMYLANEDNEKAVKLLDAYTKKNPKDVGLRVRLGDAYFSTQKTKQAKQEYEKAFELQSDYPGLAGKLATIYSLENNLEAAEKMFKIASEQSPANYDYLVSLSSVQLANNKPQDAIGSAKKALQLKASSELYITLGAAYEVINKPENALIAYQRAKDLGLKDQGLEDKIAKLQTN